MRPDLEGVTCHPLSWPQLWPRAKRRERSRFGQRSMDKSSRAVLAELGRMGVPDFQVIISTNVELRRDGLPYSNQKTPSDPGAAVYFKLKGEPKVLACDRWDLPEHNLWAIAKHIEALRGQDRWGVGTLAQAFQGYTALPAVGDANQPPWWKRLGLSGPTHDEETIRRAYRDRALTAHPDKGGTQEGFAALSSAHEEGLAYARNGVARG